MTTRYGTLVVVIKMANYPGLVEKPAGSNGRRGLINPRPSVVLSELQEVFLAPLVPLHHHLAETPEILASKVERVFHSRGDRPESTVKSWLKLKRIWMACC